MENEEKLTRMVGLELQYEGYEVEKAFGGCAGLDRALSGKFGLMLLDIILPALSDTEVLRRPRQESAMSAITLTVRGTVVNKMPGPNMGTNDYTTKPFAIEESLAHIRVVLCKRPAQTVGPPRSLPAVGPLTMDTDQHEASVNDEGVELTRWEFDLLHYLLENGERVISRESLLDHVWGLDFVGETNAVDICIRFLWAEIGERFGIKPIRIVRGVGYVIREEG